MLKSRSKSLGLLVIFCLVGCETPIYRAETVLNSDGSLSRAIYQPENSTPEKAKKAENWTGTRRVERIPLEKWEGKVSEQSPAKDNDSRAYFAAWGDFASVAKLPVHYASNIPEHELLPKLERKGYPFVTEFLWSEELTEILSLQSMKKARGEMADLLIPLFVTAIQQVCEEEFGGKYDVRKLEKFLRTEIMQFTADLHVAIFEEGAKRQTLGLGLGTPLEVLRPTFEDVCRKHGFDPKMFLDNDPQRAERMFREFLKQHYQALILKTGGTPLTAQQANQLVHWTFPDNSDKEKPQPLKKKMDRLISHMDGGKTAFEERWTQLLVQMIGANFPLIGEARLFEYSMTVPGTVVKTNGEIRGLNKVHWSFGASHAWPLGYMMQVHSRLLDLKSQQILLGKTPLTKPDNLKRWIALMDTSQELKTAMQQCVAEKSLAPFHKLYVKATPADKEEAATELLKNIQWAYKLLGLELPKAG